MNNSSDSSPDSSPKEKDTQIDFSLVLASAVHDMKNSLCMLIQSIDTLSDIEAKDQNPQKASELAKIHYEASRLNTNLLQMLSLYRADQNQLPVMIEEHYIEDIIEEVIAKNALYSENKGIVVETHIDPELLWFLDEDLIGNLLNDVFVNALRYTDSTICISADTVDEQLQIQIRDNGSGYPEQMLADNNLMMQELDLSNNRTGLGLFFARLIASAHKNKGKTGYIKLANITHSTGNDNENDSNNDSNNNSNSGSVFTLVLP